MAGSVERDVLRKLYPSAELPFLLARSGAYQPSAADALGGLDLLTADLDALVALVGRSIAKTTLRRRQLQVLLPGWEMVARCRGSAPGWARVGLRTSWRNSHHIFRIVALEHAPRGASLCVDSSSRSNLELFLRQAVTLEGNPVGVPIHLSPSVSLDEAVRTRVADSGCEASIAATFFRLDTLRELSRHAAEAPLVHDSSIGKFVSCHSGLREGGRGDPSGNAPSRAFAELEVLRRLTSSVDMAEAAANRNVEQHVSSSILHRELEHQIRVIRQLFDWLVNRVISVDAEGRWSLVNVTWTAFMERGEAFVAARLFKILADSGVMPLTCADESERFSRVVEYKQRLGSLGTSELTTAVDFAANCAEALADRGTPRHKAHFVLARLQDIQGLLPEAFLRLELAHKLKREQRGKQAYRFEEDPVFHVMRSMTKHYSAEAFHRLRQIVSAGGGRDGIGSRRLAKRRQGSPVFIVGLPRSGTSLVHQMLAAFPGVRALGESPAMEELDVALRSAYLGIPKEKAAAHFVTQDYLHLLTEDGLDQARTYFFNYLKLQFDTSDLLINKNVFDFAYAGLIKLVFPDSPIVHVRRDVRDVALSIFFQDFLNVDFASSFEDIISFVAEYRRLMEHWRDVLGINMFEVSYEAFVADEAERRRLVDYVGLKWDEEIAAGERWRRTEVIKTCSYCQTRSSLYNSSVGRWRGYAGLIGSRRLATLAQ
eukprot:TRINITY_DN42186_c0_g1_i1.p1 TRINITY_DN42186_c0_g1~~TRINITY_DN42186_c0_g1_i1.p1  ORF type:complete len:781 (-),score=111.37 TRINITY_DN42186_c0_g1_i1:272-2407(-)